MGLILVANHTITIKQFVWAVENIFIMKITSPVELGKGMPLETRKAPELRCQASSRAAKRLK